MRYLKSWSKFHWALVLCLLFSLIPLPIAAANDQISENDLLVQQQQAQQQLDLEQQRLKLLQQQNEGLTQEKTAQWQMMLSQDISIHDVTNAQLAATDAESNVNNISISLSAAQSELNAVLQMQKTMTQEYTGTDALSSVERVKQILHLRELLNQTLSLMQQRIDVLLDQQKLAAQRLEVIQRWYQQIDQLYHFHIKQTERLHVMLSSTSLAKQNEELIKQFEDTTQQLMMFVPKNTRDEQTQGELQFKILVIREKITINQIALLLLQLRQYFHPNFIVNPQQITLLQLQENLQQVDQSAQQLDRTIKQIKQKLAFIETQKQAVFKGLSSSQRDSHNQALTELYQAYQTQLLIASDFQGEMTQYEDQLEQIHKGQFSIRQQLPGWSLGSWIDLIKQLVTVPIYLWHSLQDSVVELIFQLKLHSNLGIYIFAAIVIFLVAIWFLLRKTFHRLLQKLEESSKRFSSQVLTIIVRLLRRNSGSLLLLLALFIIKWELQLDIALWISILLIFLSYRLVVMLMRIWLLESVGSIDGKDVRLYNGLKWIIALSCLFSIIIIVAHVFPVGYEVRVLCNKILMFLLFALSMLLLRFWAVLPLLIQKIFAARRTYVVHCIRLVCAVVPITLLTNALIGLIGYVQLAWVMGGYQLIALLTLTFYMLMRGLFMDFMDFAYQRMIAQFKSGWLWTQVFARPLEHVVRILLFVLAVLVFVYWSGLNHNATFSHYWHLITHITLLNLFGNIITVPILLQSIIIVALLCWFAKWSREFAFRWLYAKARDIGVRNSMSIFTQYAVVAIGAIMGLRIIGFDLTGFAVVAAAFAAGVGFGLRDLLTNFFSGVLLLIERPFRTGDTISLGEYEGEVVSTGFRSMKIRTWDRMELIVPNSDMFSKPFVNWTHQDSIVRSVARLCINRVDDPHVVQKLITDLFKEIPSVVTDPPAEVYMKELANALIEFEVRYFVNLQIHDSRPRVRSEVLFAIWDCFKKHGIHAPDLDYNVRILRDDE